MGNTIDYIDIWSPSFSSLSAGEFALAELWHFCVWALAELWHFCQFALAERLISSVLVVKIVNRPMGDIDNTCRMAARDCRSRNMLFTIKSLSCKVVWSCRRLLKEPDCKSGAFRDLLSQVSSFDQFGCHPFLQVPYWILSSCRFVEEMRSEHAVPTITQYQSRKQTVVPKSSKAGNSFSLLHSPVTSKIYSYRSFRPLHCLVVCLFDRAGIALRNMERSTQEVHWFEKAVVLKSYIVKRITMQRSKQKCQDT